MRFLYALIILIPCIFGSANSLREETEAIAHAIPTSSTSTSHHIPFREIVTEQLREIPDSESSREPKKWLLSLNGGGIRGIMQLKMLAEIEKLTQKSIIELFDGISGTSIGGIIACVLTMPDPENREKPKYSPQNLLDFFTANKDRFFVSKWQSMGGLFRTHYKTTSLKNMLLELLGDNLFSQRLLPVKLTCADLQLQQARFFRSTGPEEFYTRELAMATAAAPTYFKPQLVFPLNVSSHSGYLLSDGGIFMNNPVLAGKRLMTRVYGVNPSEIRILSLGTGTIGNITRAESLKRGGILSWAPAIANLCISASSSADHYDVNFTSGCNYHYFSPLIGEHNSGLDDVSDENIRALLIASQRTIGENEFLRVAELIKSNYELKIEATRALTAA